MEPSLNHILKQTGLYILQSQPMCRIHCGQYQASSAALLMIKHAHYYYCLININIIYMIPLRSYLLFYLDITETTSTFVPSTSSVGIPIPTCLPTTSPSVAANTMVAILRDYANSQVSIYRSGIRVETLKTVQQ